MAAIIPATVASGCSIVLGCDPCVCEMWAFARSAILSSSAGGMTRSSSPTTYQRRQRLPTFTLGRFFGESSLRQRTLFHRHGCTRFAGESSVYHVLQSFIALSLRCIDIVMTSATMPRAARQTAPAGTKTSLIIRGYRQPQKPRSSKWEKTWEWWVAQTRFRA
jgi:hypothetical protein